MRLISFPAFVHRMPMRMAGAVARAFATAGLADEFKLSCERQTKIIGEPSRSALADIALPERAAA